MIHFSKKSRCAVFAIFMMYSSVSAAGTYTIYTNNSEQSFYNKTASISFDATYYRDIVITYQATMSAAFMGYLNATVKHYCDSSKYAEKKFSAPGSGWQNYTDTLPSNCARKPLTVQWEGSGWWTFAGDIEVRNISVSGIKDPPVISSSTQSISTTKNSPTGSITINATDPQNAPLTGETTSGPANGSVTWTGNTFVYTPSNCFYGTDTFKYRAKETIRDQLSSSEVTVTVTVNDQNFPPSISALSNVSIPWYKPHNIALSGIAAGTCGGPNITITATSSNTNSVIAPQVIYTSPAATGTVVLTPKNPPNQQNSASTITVNLNDGKNTNSITFQTTVNWAALFKK